jgi:hypothetical protein
MALSVLKNKNRIDNQRKHDKIKVRYYVNYHSIVELFQIMMQSISKWRKEECVREVGPTNFEKILKGPFR